MKLLQNIPAYFAHVKTSGAVGGGALFKQKYEVKIWYEQNIPLGHSKRLFLSWTWPKSSWPIEKRVWRFKNRLLGHLAHGWVVDWLSWYHLPPIFPPLMPKKKEHLGSGFMKATQMLIVRKMLILATDNIGDDDLEPTTWLAVLVYRK